MTESRPSLRLFVFLKLCYVLFRWVRDAGVSGCFETTWVTSFRGVVCMRQLPSGCCHSSSHVYVYPATGRLLFCSFIPLPAVCSFARLSRYRPFALLFVEGPSPCVLAVGEIRFFFLFLSSFLVYFPVNISLMFLLCWKAIIWWVWEQFFVGYFCLCGPILL